MTDNVHSFWAGSITISVGTRSVPSFSDSHAFGPAWCGAECTGQMYCDVNSIREVAVFKIPRFPYHMVGIISAS